MSQLNIITHRRQSQQVKCLGQTGDSIQGLLHFGVENSILNCGFLSQRTDLSQRIVGICCRIVCLILKVSADDNLYRVNRGKQQLELPDLLLVGQERRKLISRQIEFAGCWCRGHQNASGSIWASRRTNDTWASLSPRKRWMRQFLICPCWNHARRLLDPMVPTLMLRSWLYALPSTL